MNFTEDKRAALVEALAGKAGAAEHYTGRQQVCPNFFRIRLSSKNNGFPLQQT